MAIKLTSSLTPPPYSTHTDPVVCSNTEDTHPLSYYWFVRKNDTKVTVKISKFVDKEET